MVRRTVLSRACTSVCHYSGQERICELNGLRPPQSDKTLRPVRIEGSSREELLDFTVEVFPCGWWNAPKGMHYLALSPLKTGPPDFHGWWTPLGDEGLFSEGHDSLGNPYNFRPDQPQGTASPHRSKLCDLCELGCRLKETTCYFLKSPSRGSTSKGALVKISWSFDGTLFVLVVNQELCHTCNTIWGIFLQGISWCYKVSTCAN